MSGDGWDKAREAKRHGQERRKPLLPPSVGAKKLHTV